MRQPGTRVTAATREGLEMLQTRWPQGTLSSVQPRGAAWSPPDRMAAPEGAAALPSIPPLGGNPGGEPLRPADFLLSVKGRAWVS